MNLNQVQEFLSKKASDFSQPITIRARIQHARKCSNKMTFLLLQHQEKTLQVVIVEDTKNHPELTREMIKSYAKIKPESIVEVTGILTKSPTEIKTATFHHFELKAYKLEMIQEVSEDLPIQIYKPDSNIDVRLNHRVLDLRSQSNQIIFQTRSFILQVLRQFFYQNDFMEIQTPKLLAYASESGASVFEVKYFDTTAYLAQSPQFYKQMAINSGFNRVFEVAPVFRAENSDTSRHLTEFIGVDMEMEIVNDRSEVIQMLYNLLKYLFTTLSIHPQQQERLTIWNQLVEDPFLKLPKFEEPEISPDLVTITYQEAIKLLETEEPEYQIQCLEDLNHQDTITLAKIIKKKYQTDLFLMDEFPSNIKPFYAQPKENQPEVSLAYDFIFRGKEILSGAQRVNDYHLLKERLEKSGNSPESVQDYLESFRYGSPKHGGGGFGLERILGAYFQLENVRNCSLFPRDPKRLF